MKPSYIEALRRAQKIIDVAKEERSKTAVLLKDAETNVQDSIRIIERSKQLQKAILPID